MWCEISGSILPEGPEGFLSFAAPTSLVKAEQLQDIAPANLTLFLHLRKLIQIR